MSLDGDSYYAYAGGYMLLRCFAKQVADAFNGNTSFSPMLAGSAADALYAFSTDPVTGTDGSWGLDTGQSDMVTVSTGIDSFANSTSKNFISKSFSDNKPI